MAEKTLVNDQLTGSLVAREGKLFPADGLARESNEVLLQTAKLNRHIGMLHTEKVYVDMEMQPTGIAGLFRQQLQCEVVKTCR
ncbi:MAG TPA: hypothetical protein PKM88_02595 [bacterium]|nr:hypothetical protein [bacterium]